MRDTVHCVLQNKWKGHCLGNRMARSQGLEVLTNHAAVLGARGWGVGTCGWLQGRDRSWYLLFNGSTRVRQTADSWGVRRP